MLFLFTVLVAALRVSDGWYEKARCRAGEKEVFNGCAPPAMLTEEAIWRQQVFSDVLYLLRYNWNLQDCRHHGVAGHKARAAV